MLDTTTSTMRPTTPVVGDLSILSGTRTPAAPRHLIRPVETSAELAAYHSLRHAEFVTNQGLFDGSDLDDIDDDPRTISLVAFGDGTVLGGVRIAPCAEPDIGWWAGSRLVVSPAAHTSGLGAALIRAACAEVESRGALRFDAVVQSRFTRLFRSLGWSDCGPDVTLRGRPHRRMRYPIERIQHAADTTKSPLAAALAPFRSQQNGLGPHGFRGDDGTPVPGTDLTAACDAVLPSMVERDPEWAGWCSVLVNINDLSAMGARPVGLLDAVGAPTRSHLSRIIRGIADAASAWQTPVLGGHTQLGVPASLSVTALGHSPAPIASGAGAVGDTISLIADTGGGWRPRYAGRQWDSTSRRSSAELVRMAGLLGDIGPRAAKDVSMAGLAGTLGMLAEASGTGAELNVAAIPRPGAATMGDWITCFPGFAMIVADHNTPATEALPEQVRSAACGRLTARPGVRLRWPDGTVTTAISGGVTGLGTA